MIQTTLTCLLIGKPKPFGPQPFNQETLVGELSAMGRTATEHPVMLGFTGFDGDEVADRVNHGGRDKAVHLYPAGHYPFWQGRDPDQSLFNQPGAFGENLSCAGLTEDQLCLGDIFRIGEALVQCSHARQPCWKLNHHLGQKDIVKTIIKTARSGSYFRVLEPGYVQAGDMIEHIERPLPQWPLDRLFHLLIGGAPEREAGELMMLAENPVLAASWRQRALARIS